MTAVAANLERSRGRPLYIVGPRGCVIDLDGPALNVRVPGAAVARYPLQRISRIISAAGTSWRPRAVSACISSQIPVVFLGPDGEPAGYLQPMARSRSSLSEALDEMLSRPDWEGRYANWLRAERMRIVRVWHEARAAGSSEAARGALHEVIRRHVNMADHPTSAPERCGIIGAALMALACEQIHSAGAAHRYAGFGGSELDLVGDLHRLLRLALDLDIHGLGDSLGTDAGIVLRVVQAHVQSLTERSRGILGRLHRRAMELVQQWH